METAKNGVIYFSMGSNLKSKDWPEEIKQGLLKMFGALKQTVLWKFEEDLPNVPKNVHILKWAPQPSILGESSFLLKKFTVERSVYDKFLDSAKLSNPTRHYHSIYPVTSLA